jgi:hypothetical protein
MGERWNAAMNCWGENPSPLRSYRKRGRSKTKRRLNFLLCPILLRNRTKYLQSFLLQKRSKTKRD